MCVVSRMEQLRAWGWSSGPEGAWSRWTVSPILAQRGPVGKVAQTGDGGLSAERTQSPGALGVGLTGY